MALSLSNADIVTALPILADINEKADSGTTSTLACTRLKNMLDEEIVGATISFVSGANKGIDDVITSYTDATGTLGFATQTEAITNSTVFAVILKNYTSYIERAEDIISNDMRNKGKDISLYLTTSQLKELHLLKTLELICLAKRQDASLDDVFHINYEMFASKYNLEMDTLKADYDYDEDGTIDTDEEKVTGQVRLSK